MNKLWVYIIIAGIIFTGIVFGTVFYNGKKDIENTSNASNTENAENMAENLIENKLNEVSKVTDECTEEYENSEELEVVISQEEKISPNCKMIMKKTYKLCNHTIDEYVDVPQSLVNKTQKDLEKEYPYWKIEKFSSEEIIISKEFESYCGQNFKLKNENGKIVIYKIDEENGEEELYEKTDISTQYLSETDRNKLQSGIAIIGIENLNKSIEDFE